MQLESEAIEMGHHVLGSRTISDGARIFSCYSPVPMLLFLQRLLLWLPFKRLISFLSGGNQNDTSEDQFVSDMGSVVSNSPIPIALSNEVVEDLMEMETERQGNYNETSTTTATLSIEEEDPLEDIMERSLENNISDREMDMTPMSPGGPVAVAISDVVVEDSLVEELITSKPIKSARSTPSGDRWAIAQDGVNLTGNWEVIVTDEFKEEYDNYLTNLGQPLLVRTFALGVIPFTTEEIKQSDNGRALLIRGKNLQGNWDRTLVSSGAEPGNDKYTPLHIPIITAESEQVEAESWWESKGTVHVSWLRNITKYGGGAFESRRYLEDDGDVYVCESTYYPDDKDREPCSITWRFKRIEEEE
jgi:hypothetical protein